MKKLGRMLAAALILFLAGPGPLSLLGQQELRLVELGPGYGEVATRGSALGLEAGIDLRDIPLRTALEYLRAASGAPLAFSPSLLPRDLLVSCECREVGVGEALSTLLADSGFEYAVVGRQIVIRETAEREAARKRGLLPPADRARSTRALRLPTPDARPVAHSMTRNISGRVAARASGQGIATAQISVLGTGLGTLTDPEGRFEIQVPAREVTLMVQRIGFRTAEVVVPLDQAQVEILMEVDFLGLDEIVVTGRATGTPRRNLPHAVSSLNQEELNRVPTTSMEQQLYGKIAGANIQSNTHAPGGGMQVRLRGPSTFIGSHTPLYVVDGVIVSDVTVPSGVHQVTASSGNPVAGSRQDNAPNRIADLNPNDIESIEILKGASASAIYGSKANNGVVIIRTRQGQTGRPQYNIRQRVGVSAMANQVGFRRFDTLEDAVSAFGARAEEYWAPGRFYDHEKELAGSNPVSWELSGSASGAVGDTRYFFSGLALNEEGILTGTGHEKQSVRLNLNQRLGERLTLDVNTNAVRSQTARGFTQNDNRSISYWMTLPRTPTFVDLRRRADGSFPTNPFSNSNPLQTAALSRNDETVWRFIGSVNSEFTAVSNASHLVRVLGIAGADLFAQKNDLLTPPELQFEPLNGLPGTSLRGSAYNQNINLSLSAVHDFTPERLPVRFTTSVGTQYEVRDLDLTRTTARNLIGGLSNVDKGTTLEVFQRRERVEDVGFFVQEDVLVGDRLLLTASVRGDRSSNNADPSEVFWYPKVAGSYRFLDFFPGVNEVKVRGAVGASGNQPLFGQKFTEFQGENIDGLSTLSVLGITAASDLRPERQREIEGGIDVIFFDERATVELTAFQQNITDVLLQRELPASSGFSTAIFNGGETRIRGLEAGVTAVPILRDDLTWNARLTWSLDRSKIIELGVPPFVTGGFGFLYGAFFAREGGSMTDIWGNVTQPDGSVRTELIGNASPDFRMGLTNNVQWGDFSVAAVLDWQKGSNVIHLTRLLADLARNSPDCNVIRADGESECARRIRLWPTDTSVYMESGSFLKLREMAVTYSVPQSVVERWLPGSPRFARLSFSARDLLRITNYSGMDPEVSNFGSQAIGRNVDVAAYPPSRSFWFSVDFGF